MASNETPVDNRVNARLILQIELAVSDPRSKTAITAGSP
jgi:hypothetical protein